MVNSSYLLRNLLENISNNEWLLLKNKNNSLIISDFNRSVILNMKKYNIEFEKNIPKSELYSLSNKLKNYLNKYMIDKPEGHKWIIIASLYLTYIEEKPMHPLEITKIKIKNIDGKTTYFCPLKSKSDDDICSYCVCKYLDKNGPL